MTDSEKIMLTQAGAVRLRDELKQLTSVDRPAVIDAIAEARGHGDLSENAEYDAAIEQQGFIEARIHRLESALSNAEVIDPATLGGGGKIVFGATARLCDIDDGGETTYQLVGEFEADIEHRRISINSPLGRALLGKTQGDEVEVAVPAGKRVYEILKVDY